MKNKIFTFFLGSLIVYGNLYGMGSVPSTPVQDSVASTLLELEHIFADFKHRAPMPSAKNIELFKKKNSSFPDDEEKIIACIKKQHAIVAFKNMCNERDVDLNMRDEKLNTLLHVFHMAQIQNLSQHDSDFAEALLEAGVKIADENGNGLQNDEKRTAFFIATFPLDIAFYRGNKHLIKLYLQHGANPYEFNYPFLFHIFSHAISAHSAFEQMIMMNDLESIALCVAYKAPPSVLRHLVLAVRHSGTPLLKIILGGAPYSAKTLTPAISMLESNVAYIRFLIATPSAISHILQADLPDQLSVLEENTTLLQGALADKEKRQHPLMHQMKIEFNKRLTPYLEDLRPSQPERNVFLALRARESGLAHRLRVAQTKKKGDNIETTAPNKSHKRKLEPSDSKEDKDDE